ncbi:sensor histidine kinase [Phormidesmis sp. 146-12]
MEEIFPLIELIPLRQGQSLQLTPAASPCLILGDSNRLKQVIINLISNASEAIEPGDQITCCVIASPSHVCIQVHNRGQPIPPDELSKLTQPFYTTKPCGTGLGLAIVKRIIETHNGELKIQSDAISGTTVTIQLPQFRQTQAEP